MIRTLIVLAYILLLGMPGLLLVLSDGAWPFIVLAAIYGVIAVAIWPRAVADWRT
jgi:hypothetical protein